MYKTAHARPAYAVSYNPKVGGKNQRPEASRPLLARFATSNSSSCAIVQPPEEE